jgi:hypothetical protein
VPSGLRKCLAYAVRYKIQHVVFVIDSQGGDQVAAREIYELLGKYSDRVKYHALVRDSVGVAMAAAVWCDSVFLLPGANLGGVILTFDEEPTGAPEVLRSQIAWEVGTAAEKRGWPAAIVRAMIDPQVRVVAWRDGGSVQTGVRPPPSVSRGDLIVAARPGTVLTLSRAEAAALGIGRTFEGSAAGLGYELGLDPWVAEGDYGARTMIAAARARQKELQSAARKTEASIHRLLERRKSIERFVERNLTIAHEWDPKQSAYSEYDKHVSSWERYWGGAPIPGTITRSRWRELTDVTLRALSEARKGIVEMKKLDDEAESLGIERSYPEEELDRLLDDTEIKMQRLMFWRKRKTSAT